MIRSRRRTLVHRPKMPSGLGGIIKVPRSALTVFDYYASQGLCISRGGYRGPRYGGEYADDGVPPRYAIDQVFADPQVQHLGMAQHVPNDENRHIRLVSQPVTLSRTPSKMAARPPEFGEQTEEVLAEFGFGKDEIAELRQRKVV